jgi:hypothetical protein
MDTKKDNKQTTKPSNNIRHHSYTLAADLPNKDGCEKTYSDKYQREARYEENTVK